MNTNVYTIRYTAIKQHLLDDKDYLRYNREISRLSIDVLAALRRCANLDDPCDDLVQLQNVLDDILVSLRNERVA